MSRRDLPAHGELLRKQAAVHSERLFAVVDNDTRTYADLYQRALAVARGLYARGVRRGDRVGILMPNCIEFFETHLGIQLLGAITVTINARYKSFELRHAIRKADIRLLFTTDRIDEHVNFADLLFESFPDLAAARANDRLHLEEAPRLEAIVLCGNTERAPFVRLDQFTAGGAAFAEKDCLAPACSVSVDDVAVVLFTSGTTAAPKACQLTHAGLYQTWAYTYPDAVRVKPGEKIWVPMPLFHVGGIGLTVSALCSGAAFVTSIHHEGAAALRLLREHRVEHLYPGFFTLMLPVMRAPGYDKESIRHARSMACVAPFETHMMMKEQLPPHLLVLQLFGMSEAGGYVTFTRPEREELHRLQTNGTPIDGVEVRIVDPETGAVLPADVQGELQFRGPNSFHSYYEDEAATRATILEGGWVSTGDCGRIDPHGTTFFLGRIKDMLKVGGENVAAAEIEAFMGRHPAVKLTQVVGKTDAVYGEVAVAFVELLPGKQATADELIAFCKGRLSSFKIPREVRFVTEWPMSSTKIQKFKLRELLK
jgi:fatty-acyl-CoA synthase